MECVHAGRIYTGKSVIEEAFVVFDKQKIVEVSGRPRGTLCGEFAVLTPAFVDPHSHIGMARAGEPSRDGEANDRMDSVLTLPDALDSLQMDDTALRDAVEMGVLYSCILPGSGNIIGGRTAVIRNYAEHSTEALIARAGLKAAFGYNPMSTQDWKGSRPTTRMGAAAVLRKHLRKVLQKVEEARAGKGRRPAAEPLSAEEGVLQELLAGKLLLRAHVHKIDDIATLLRIVDEFKIRVTVEHAMDVHRPEIFAELKKRRIPVVYGPVDGFAYKVELKHENWRNIGHLLSSGVGFGLMTDHPVTPARQLLLQTRWFIRSGLSRQQAIEIITRRNAKILGIERMVGTLQKGMWASFLGWNGDPFDLACFPQAVYAEGKRIFSET